MKDDPGRLRPALIALAPKLIRTGTAEMEKERPATAPCFRDDEPVVEVWS